MREELPKNKHRYYPKIHDHLPHPNDNVVVSIMGEALVERCGKLMPCVMQAYGGLNLIEEAVE